MKLRKIIIVSISLSFLSLVSFTQDSRTTATKVADLLARLPARDNQLTDKLMGDMQLLGDAGLKLICDQIIPDGTADDSRPRLAVESYSRFLTRQGKEADRKIWEKICIDYAIRRKDNSVREFFMKQLQMIGGIQSIEAMKGYLANRELCGPALAVITAVGGKTAESVLAEALKNYDLPCAASVMNTLASMKSHLAVNEYIVWASGTDINIKASAYNALAMSGSPQAYPVLSKAARDVAYRWEHTGATAALLNYGDIIAQDGDIKKMDKICKLVISKCRDNLTVQNKIDALNIYVKFHGLNAMPYILKAAASSNSKYRTAAIRMSLTIPGEDVVTKWISFFTEAVPEARPEIIAMLGIRGDDTALPLIISSLSAPDKEVRKEAAAAIVKISGKKAIPSLIDYMMKFSSDFDQEAAKSALMSVMGSNDMPLLIPVLKEGPVAARKTAIDLLAWSKDNKFFSVVFPFTSSTEEPVKSAAYKALVSLAGSGDQENLLELLAVTENPGLIADIQATLAVAAGKVPDPEKKSDILIKYFGQNIDASKFTETRIKIIPVLAKTGGREALAVVLKEFENGNPELRDVCFKTLTNWLDYSASSALYEICISGNKTFEGPAFEGYVRQIKTADLPDDEKLLLFRKIMPYALSPARKSEILKEVGKLKSYQSFFFVSTFLDDPSTSAEAAKAAMYIALPSVNSKAGLYGELVKNFLTKAVTKLSGQESEYDKEMVNKYIAQIPADKGFESMFNGKDLTGWHGIVENPFLRARMKPSELAKKQIEADRQVSGNWSVKNGCIMFNGSGENLCSIKEYGDFELLVDWKISKAGDGGIYLRGTPKIQIWDTSNVEAGAHYGSGGLYNNENNTSKPLKVADNPVGDWNSFHIVMEGEKVSVWLNGLLVVDNVIMENYWDRKIPVFPKGPIELQAHGTDLAFRDIYIREISEKEFNLTPEERSEGFVALFNGHNLDNWVGNKESYVAEDSLIIVKPGDGTGGNLFTEDEYSDFIFRFEFQLTTAANSGLGIRAPLTGDAAYVGMELQILDDTAPVYANLQPYQYNGSVYGVIPAKRGYLKPVGEWNYEEVIVKGTQIKINLNGTTIVDGDIAGPRDNGTMDHKDHPGLKNKTGHIGFLGHGSELKFRNIRIKDLSR